MWYYYHDNERKGPIAEEVIIDMITSGTLKSDTLVWTKGQENWKKIPETTLAIHLPAPEPPELVEIGPPEIPKPGFDIERYRHPKEILYLVLASIMGGLIYFIFFFLTFGLIIYSILFGVFVIGFIAERSYKAKVYGNAIKISETQYPEIHDLIIEIAAKLNMKKIPEVFLLNQDGQINALAIKFLKLKFVMLYSSMVDLMLKRNKLDELKVIIAHELAHHEAGHTAIWKNLLIKPAKLIPFLGNAYSRACELSADAISLAVTGDREVAKRAIVSMTCGSEHLTSSLNIESFMNQEKEIPIIIGFLNELYSTHPRTTKRIINLDEVKIS